tara:strand:+ start:234 stop:440 length:207 start_codon:yes stop_codon:yes gene_type:complete
VAVVVAHLLLEEQVYRVNLEMVVGEQQIQSPDQQLLELEAGAVVVMRQYHFRQEQQMAVVVQGHPAVE